jgi:hypothetical protein
MGGTVRIQGGDRAANSAGYAASLAVAAAPARLYSVTVYNNSGADGYIQVFDAAAVPTAGAWSAAPKLMMRVPDASQGSFDFTDGRIFTTGIAIAVSTLATNYTAATSNFLIDATYRVK